MLFVLVAFGFFRPRKTDFSYRPGNTIIPPQIKRYPAAGHLCYCLGSFMLPGRSPILEKRAREKAKAGIRKSICEFGKNGSGAAYIYMLTRMLFYTTSPTDTITGAEGIVCFIAMQLPSHWAEGKSHENQ